MKYEKLLLLTLVAVMASCQKERNIETLIVNDSICWLSYNVEVIDNNGNETGLLNYYVAKNGNGHNKLILYESYDVATPETFLKFVKAYKDEMKGEYTPE